jgi:hypothetical protein
MDERKNHIIMNMVKSMLREKNLSNDYYDEVIVYSLYILNISMTTSVNNKIAQKAWSGTNTNVYDDKCQ